jgi:hypothetical protein
MFMFDDKILCRKKCFVFIIIGVLKSFVSVAIILHTLESKTHLCLMDYG